jgi:hypothetical protein
MDLLKEMKNARENSCDGIAGQPGLGVSWLRFD